MQHDTTISTILTVVIVNWNTREFLSRCLAALSRDADTVPMSIVVVDNASIDGSVEMLRRDYPHVTVVANTENVGFVRANNQALALAVGEWILYLNPDTELQAGALNGMLAYGRSHPDAGAIGPQLLNSDGTLQNSAFRFPNLGRLFLEYIVSSALASRLERPTSASMDVVEVDVIRGACLLVRLPLVRDIGGMNERLFMYAEETDLCHKVAARGYTRMLLPDCRVIHHERQSVRQQREWLMRYHYIRSTIVFLGDNYTRPRARLCIAIIKAGLYSRWAFDVVRGGSARRGQWNMLLQELKTTPGW